MFANFFKNLIVNSFGKYIEDFTSDDIVIDKWNGQVVKDNVAIKKTALEDICMGLIGAPVNIVKGYIKKLRINIPWNKLLSKPCEVFLDELHVIIKNDQQFDKEFYKKMIWKNKKKTFQELIEQIRKQQSLKEEDKKVELEQQDGYMKRLNKIISENLRLIVTNIHIRFEDNLVSRNDQLFNFGIIAENLNYSMTNNNFERVFINIDDKKQEQRSYSMLEIKSMALYWNSNVQENWTQNEEFMNLSASRHLEYSKKFSENMRKKYQQYLQNLTTNIVFVIQPCDIRLRIRKNLSPHLITELPKTTTALDFSPVYLTIDEEIYKDIQYLLKFFSWHSNGSEATQLVENKKLRDIQFKQKRQMELLELSAIYTMKTINDYYIRNNASTRKLTLHIPERQQDLIFDSEKQLEARLIKLEYKLSPEQSVIAYMKSEKQASDIIQQENENSGWRYWIPGKIKDYYMTRGTKETDQSISSISSDLTADFDTIMQNYQDIIDDNQDDDEQEESSAIRVSQINQSTISQNAGGSEFKFTGFKEKTLGHFNLQIPKMDVSFVSKRQGTYSKYFMLITIQEIFFQTLSNQKEGSKLFYIKNFEIIDKLSDKQKFAKALIRKEQIQYDIKSEKFPQIKKGLIKMMNQQALDKSEIEEEANTNINNGLPLIKEYELVLEGSGPFKQPPLFMIQLLSKVDKKKTETKKSYKIDVFLDSMSIFYNRVLISRAQKFINQAIINKIQNVEVEKDFDLRMQKLKAQTQQKMARIIESSEIFLCCNIKGVEFLIPDNTNYDASKFIMINTGNIIVSKGEQNIQKYTMRKQLQQYITENHSEMCDELQFNYDEEYSLRVYDFQVLYIPSLQQLENVQYFDSSDLDKHNIFKKTDLNLVVQIQNQALDNNEKIQRLLIQSSINNLEIQLTNKEVKELKNFSDNFIKYHEQISLEVQSELDFQISLINFQNQKILEDQQKQNKLIEQNNNEEEKVETKYQSAINNNYQSIDSHNYNSLSDAPHENQQVSSLTDHQLNDEEEDEDEFYDASDVFDRNVLQLLKLNQNFQKIEEDVRPSTINKQTNVNRKFILEFWINKIKLTILEAANFSQELQMGLRQRLGSFGGDQFDIDVKYKGVPFLFLEINKTGLMAYKFNNQALCAFGLKQISIVNQERQNIPTVILRSQNVDIDNFFSQIITPNVSINKKPKPLFDIEDEDKIEQNTQYNDSINEYFTKFIFKQTKAMNEATVEVNNVAKIEIGMIDVNLNDNFMTKFMDTMVTDFPMNIRRDSSQSHVQSHDNQQSKTQITIDWEGIQALLNIKKDQSIIKLSDFKLNLKKSSDESTINMSLEDLRILQNDCELVLKYSDNSWGDAGSMIQISIINDNQRKYVEVNIEQLLVILEMNQILLFSQSMIKVKKIANSQKPGLRRENTQHFNQQPNNDELLDIPKKESTINVILKNSYAQIPIKDSKNSLYFWITELTYQKQREEQVVEIQQAQFYVAKLLDQQFKYRLLVIENMRNIQKFGLLSLSFDKIYAYVNENFILLLANILEQHFEDTVNLIYKLILTPNDSSQQNPLINPLSHNILTLDQVEQITNQIQTCEIVNKILTTLESVTKIISINCGVLGLQWIFSQGFDDHEESFVTLFNKNFSQQILSQFDQLNNDTEFKEPSPTKIPTTSNIDDNQNSAIKYESLQLEINDICLNIIKSQLQDQCKNLTAIECKGFYINNILKSQEVSTIFQIRNDGSIMDQQISLQFIKDDGLDLVETIIQNIDIQMTNLNAKVISVIAKSIYSCKNIIKRGKKRELVKKILATLKKDQDIEEQTPNPTSFILDIKQWKLMFYEQEEPKTAEINPNISQQTIFLKQMASSLSGLYQEPRKESQINSCLILEGSVQIERSFQKKSIKANNREQILIVPKSHFNLHGVTLYLEQKQAHMYQLDFMNSEKIVLIHPFMVNMELENSESLNSNEKQTLISLQMSILEIEFSLKQFYYIKFLYERIYEEFKPLQSMIKHLSKQQAQVVQKKEIEYQPASDQKQQRTIKIFKIQSQAIYLSLIKESGEYQSNDLYCYPIFSLEAGMSQYVLKQVSQQKLEGSSKAVNEMNIEGQIPFEVYYFNTKLNFYEPLIERTELKIVFSNDKNSNQVFGLNMNKILNVNFSVALYDNIFNLINTFKEEKQVYKMLKESKNEKLIQANINRDLKFTPSKFNIKNSTGEIIYFKTAKQLSFTELQANEQSELEFDQLKYIPEENKEDQESAGSDNENFEEYEENDEFNQNQIQHNIMKESKPVSKYRREKLRYLRGQPKKVFFQIQISSEQNIDRTSVFEINIDSLTCQRIYLDGEKRQLYIICQTQMKNGSKHLIIRSPMQITNNLQIPMEVQLIQGKRTNRQIITQRQESLNEGPNSSLFENIDEFRRNQELFTIYTLIVKPESSMIIPLKACGFQNVKMRPILNQGNQDNLQIAQDSTFEWTNSYEISLLQDEREIFERKPIVMTSKITMTKDPSQKNNNRLFFLLNANIYSIRSYIDFNTQQTEFISLRYLQISPPFTIQNLLPLQMSMLFRNIQRDKSYQQQNQTQDKQIYKLEMKMNSSLQSLFLNPYGNFEMSLCVPGYEISKFMPLKKEDEEDYKIINNVEFDNYVSSLQIGEEESKGQEMSNTLKNQFRFLKNKRMIFELTSQFQDSFNVCANIQFIQGYYQITLFAKYWFLNNTYMPMMFQMTTETQQYDKCDLPYENIDFDFETTQKFIKDEHHLSKGKKDNMLERKGKITVTYLSIASLDSFQTETYKDGKSQYKSNMSQSNHKDYDEINYKDLSQYISKNNPYGQKRLKPWETYKMQMDKDAGLILALDNEDINKVSTVFMSEEQQKEELWEEEEKEKSKKMKEKTKKNVRFLGQDDNENINKRLFEEYKEEEKVNDGQLFKDKSVISKSSIQMNTYFKQLGLVQNYLDGYNELMHANQMTKEVIPLNRLPISRYQLFEVPYRDKDQLRRVVLFSENNQDELQLMKEQYLQLKICNSQWSKFKFDITKLQGESLFIQDNDRIEGQQSLYEIVASISYLPYPFSFSKIVIFQPRYVLVNKTYSTLYVIQSECEDKGLFRIFPLETSIFHWTNFQNQFEVSVRLEDYEFSGSFKIDSIGEVNLRLRSMYDQENLILNVSITEENNTFFIIASDMSYAPPYRIENLTKTTFKIAQKDSKSYDFDILKPYAISSYAWSYPLKEKLISLHICSQSQDQFLGFYLIDTIDKKQSIQLHDKKNNKQYILQINNEKTIKVIRLLYAQNAENQQLLIKDKKEQTKGISFKKLELNIPQFGLSIINSQAREIAYTFISNFNYQQSSSAKHRKIQLKIGNIQMDNQLVRQNDSIILNKQQSQSRKLFINLQMQYVINEAIENLHYYKYFILDLAPFDLNLDGNFCDEFYKYIIDIVQQTKRFMALNNEYENDVDEMKQTLNELKMPIMKTQSQAQQKVYFEQFFIHEIKLNFTFSSSPILFREFTMNPTLKFFIVLLSNMKNVQLKFSNYKIQHQHLLLPIFVAQLKKNYLAQCYSRQQILQIVSSMGLFGNIGETVSSLSNAFENLASPLQERTIQSVFRSSFLFLRGSLNAVTGSVTSIASSFKRALTYMVTQPNNEQIQRLTVDKDLFDDDITQAGKDFDNFSSPLVTIDTQNKIWVKIIQREKANYDVKKMLMKNKDQEETATIKQKQKLYLEEGNLYEFFRKQPASQQNFVFRLGTSFFGGMFSYSRSLFQQGHNLVENLNQQYIDEVQRHKLTKVRPPRFVSFRMELEPYNKQKAFALQILNDINFNAFENEIIEKLYSMQENSLILTGKRLICVKKERSQSGKELYKYWNILYTDLVKIRVLIFDIKRKVQVNKDELDQIIDEEDNDDRYSNIRYIMKLIYLQAGKEQEDFGEIDDNVYSKRQTAKRLSKHNYNGLGFEEIGNLQMNEEQIIGTYHEVKILHMFYNSLSKRINQKLIK